MSVLGGVEHCLRWLAVHGVWDVVTAVAVVSIALALRRRSQKPVRELSVHVTHSFGNDNPLFPNTLGFELRNALDAQLLITRPSFVFGKELKAGSGALVNTVTGVAELRLRSLLSDGTSASHQSHDTVLLRHREGAFAFVPLQDSLGKEAFVALAESHRLGTLQLDVVWLGESPPRSMTLRLPIQTTLEAVQEHTFGADGLARNGRRASERPSSLPLPLK